MFTLKPVTGKEFIDRKKLITEMSRELSDKRSTIGFALYGNRHVGKTSIFKEIERRFSSKNDYVCIYFSIWEIVPSTVEAFIRTFSSSIIESFRSRLPLKYKANEMAKMPGNVIRKMLREVKIGTKLSDEIEIFLTFKGSKDIEYSQKLREVFELPDKLSELCKIKCILLIDEFPSIIDIKNGKKIGEDVLGLIRTVQEDYKRTSLCISGSIKKTMESSAMLPSSPFYRQFVVKEIKPFDKNDVKDLLKRNLADSGLQVTEDALKSIFENTAGIPFYIQFLGRKLIMAEGRITKDIVEDITEEFLAEEGNIIFREEFKILSPKEKKVTISMALGFHTITDISKDINETANTTSRFLIYLLEKGVVERTDSNYYLLDPVFEKWLHMKYGDKM